MKGGRQVMSECLELTYGLCIIIRKSYQCSGSCQCIWASRSYCCNGTASQLSAHSHMSPDCCSFRGSVTNSKRRLGITPVLAIMMISSHVCKWFQRSTYYAVVRLHYIAVACDSQGFLGISHHHCGLHPRQHGSVR